MPVCVGQKVNLAQNLFESFLPKLVQVCKSQPTNITRPPCTNDYVVFTMLYTLADTMIKL